MKRKLLALILGVAAFACCTFALAACKAPQSSPEERHYHSFTAYGFDDDTHWKICPEDGVKEYGSDRYHDFSSGDCVCGKEGHKHVWSEQWSTDSFSHWHACNGCDDYDRDSVESHKIDEKPENAQFDEMNHWYLCEVCGEKFREEEHSEQPGMEKDDDGHWIACWRCDYKIDYKEHDFSNGDKCECGYDLKGTEGLEYELVSNSYYVLKSIGTATDKNIVIPSVYEGKDVTKIAADAFKDCAEIESVRFSETITEIENNAFANCTGLTSVTLPAGLRTVGNAFSGCSALESIALSGESSKLAVVDGILYGKNETSGEANTALIVPAAIKGTVNVPDGVSSINFKGCANLLKVVFGEESRLTNLASEAFKECTSLQEVILPVNLTQIGASAFYGCAELGSVTLSERLAKIGQYAFYRCGKITEINIPSSVTYIGYYTFASCYALEKVTFGENIKITQIASSTFVSCHSLKSIKIPEGVKSIGNMAFQRCIGMTDVTLPSTLSTIGESAFNGCELVEKLAIPANVTAIDTQAFSGWTALNDLTFGENSKLKTTGTGAFSKCTSLTTVTLPDTLETVGNSLFNGCTSLAEIVISENSCMKTIGNIAFLGCAISSIVIPPLSVTESGNSIGNTIFKDCENLTIIYYHGTKSEWDSLKIDTRDEALPTDERLCFYVANQEDLPDDGGNYWHFADGKPVEW